jgi:hypothetical protein
MDELHLRSKVATVRVVGQSDGNREPARQFGLRLSDLL